MTREAFIRKWLGNKDYQYTEGHRDMMRDDLDAVLSTPTPQKGDAEKFIKSSELIKWFKENASDEVERIERIIKNLYPQ
jgi:hypothetical protein